MPIGSATIPSGAQRLSSRPGAVGAVTVALPACDSFIAESAEKRTVVAVKGGTGSETSARTGAEAAAGAAAVDGSGTGTDWQASAASIPAAANEVSRAGRARFVRWTRIVN